MNSWDAPHIKKGMVAQLAKRRGAYCREVKSQSAGKSELGAPATMLKMGLSAPIVGFLMQRAQLPSGGTASLKGYSRPVAEPEICVRMARDLQPGASADQAAAAVKEILPAIELADLDPVPLLTISMPCWRVIFSSVRSFCAAILAQALAHRD